MVTDAEVEALVSRARYDGPIITRDQLVGVDTCLRQLGGQLALIARPELASRFGLEPSGTLFVGQPGTGKTATARYLSGQLGLPFYQISADEFGSDSDLLHGVFRRLSSERAILFIDEISILAQRRDWSDAEDRRMLAALLTSLDGLANDRATGRLWVIGACTADIRLDPGHPRDLTAAVRAVFDTAFGASADAIWQEAAALLDPKGHELRTWLASGFFGHHLQSHSKSRRKAPILWQLGTPSARYSIWAYAHRLTRDSLFALARDVVAPKLTLEERHQTSLVQDAGPNPTAKQRAEIAAQDAIVAELRVFADEVRRVAPLWNPDLDDGIVLVEAPLWRLVPHKPWAKELKSRWDDLVAGKYDWAHLAMQLWPERVVGKCATDRSLAIAHGLEEVFWAEGADGKWTKRARPTRPVEDLVAERTSPAVKAALAELLSAPAPAAAGRGRGRNN